MAAAPRPGTPRLPDTPPRGHPLLERLAADPACLAGLDHLRRDHDRIIEENIQLQQIPAPNREEGAKAEAFRAMLAAHGLEEVAIDAEGNALGIRRGRGGHAGMLAVVSHLDTVFPQGTDLAVRREGTRLIGPGISDNTRGPALILGLLRAMAAGGVGHGRDILFVGSVGEEGLGDLRGAKHLMRDGRYRDRVDLFIALDGSQPHRLVHGALGSRRFEVTFTGPGGHSYAAFGTVNPVNAMARAIRALAELPTPAGTTHNVGVVSGGTSINAIPLSATMQVDLRSPEPAALRRLEEQFHNLVAAAVRAENAPERGGRGEVAGAVRLVGDRPSGRTDPEHPLVRLAAASIAAQGWRPTLETASTDASVAIALGIPAVAVASGIGGKAHSLDEYLETDPVQCARQMAVAFLTILGAAEL